MDAQTFVSRFANSSALRHAALLLVCCLLVFSPYALTDDNSIYKFTIFLAAILFLVGVANRYVFSVLSFCILFGNAVYLHIKNKWGADEISSRIEVVLEAPNLEIYEYLSSYFGRFEFIEDIN